MHNETRQEIGYQFPIMLWDYILWHQPLLGRISTQQREFEVDRGISSTLQYAPVLQVVLHQLSQGGKLLTPVEVIVVTCVLYPQVYHLFTQSAQMTISINTKETNHINNLFLEIHRCLTTLENSLFPS